MNLAVRVRKPPSRHGVGETRHDRIIPQPVTHP
jgi:hypothetical protein